MSDWVDLEMSEIKTRKPQVDGVDPTGLARRATDRDLRGMKVLEDDSDSAWTEFEKALSEEAASDLPPTQPGVLE